MYCTYVSSVVATKATGHSYQCEICYQSSKRSTSLVICKGCLVLGHYQCHSIAQAKGTWCQKCVAKGKYTSEDDNNSDGDFVDSKGSDIKQSSTDEEYDDSNSDEEDTFTSGMLLSSNSDSKFDLKIEEILRKINIIEEFVSKIQPDDKTIRTHTTTEIYMTTETQATIKSNATIKLHGEIETRTPIRERRELRAQPELSSPPPCGLLSM